MRIQTIYNQGSGKVNEDRLLTADPLFAVFDGATSLEPYQDEQGNTGAALAATIVCETFAQAGNEPLTDTTRKANQNLRQAMQEKGVALDRKTALWASTVAAIRIHQDHIEWVQIADSIIVVIHKDGSFESLIHDYEHDQAVDALLQKLAGKEREEIMKEIWDTVVTGRNNMNVTYGVLSGEPEMESFLNHGSLPLDNVAHILLLTDGLFIPRKDTAQPDDLEKLVELFLKGGLQLVQDYVRDIEKSDPKGSVYPRFKPHDDIAAIALSF